jgi:hypothetical protein
LIQIGVDLKYWNPDPKILCCRRRADVVKFRGGLSVLKSIKKRKSARLKKALRKPPSTKSLLSYLQPKQVSPAVP